MIHACNLSGDGNACKMIADVLDFGKCDEWWQDIKLLISRNRGAILGINIGDNNKIKNTTIVDNTNVNTKNHEYSNSIYERHPIIISILISFTVGFLLLFSFWTDIVNWIEKLF